MFKDQVKAHCVWPLLGLNGVHKPAFDYEFFTGRPDLSRSHSFNYQRRLTEMEREQTRYLVFEYDYESYVIAKYSKKGRFIELYYADHFNDQPDIRRIFNEIERQIYEIMPDIKISNIHGECHDEVNW